VILQSRTQSARLISTVDRGSYRKFWYTAENHWIFWGGGKLNTSIVDKNTISPAGLLSLAVTISDRKIIQLKRSARCFHGAVTSSLKVNRSTNHSTRHLMVYFSASELAEKELAQAEGERSERRRAQDITALLGLLICTGAT